jgi:CheY-like chemotaxis protein
VRKRLLIVEDNVVAAQSLSMLLESYGYDCQTVDDGESALTEVSAGALSCDALVIDHYLSGIDGLTTLRHVRTTGSRVPVVLITAAEDAIADALRLELASLRPATLLRKPFSVDELALKLESLWGEPLAD